MKNNRTYRRFLYALTAGAIAFILMLPVSSCKIYKFNEAVVPDTINTIKITYFDNKARYINPQLSQALTEKVRQKVTGQTKLVQTQSENADWELTGFVTDYSFTTSAISNQQVASNQLTVSVHVILNRRKDDDVDEYDVSRSFQFKGNQSFDQAEKLLLDEITRTLADEIFNKIFSKW